MQSLGIKHREITAEYTYARRETHDRMIFLLVDSARRRSAYPLTPRPLSLSFSPPARFRLTLASSLALQLTFPCASLQPHRAQSGFQRYIEHIALAATDAVPFPSEINPFVR